MLPAINGDATLLESVIYNLLGNAIVWLLEQLGLEVFELGYESCGCGRSYPKLPACLRGP